MPKVFLDQIEQSQWESDTSGSVVVFESGATDENEGVRLYPASAVVTDSENLIRKGDPAGGDLTGTYPNPKVTKGKSVYTHPEVTGLLVHLDIVNFTSIMAVLEITGYPHMRNTPPIKSTLSFYDYGQTNYPYNCNILHLGKDIGSPYVFRGADGYLKVYFPHTGFTKADTVIFSAVTRPSTTEHVIRVEKITIPENWSEDAPVEHIQDLILEGYETRQAEVHHSLIDDGTLAQYGSDITEIKAKDTEQDGRLDGHDSALATLRKDAVLKGGAAGGDLKGTYPNPQVVKGKYAYISSVAAGILVNFDIANSDNTMVVMNIDGNPHKENTPPVKSMLTFYNYPDRNSPYRANILHMGSPIGTPYIFSGSDGYVKAYFPHTQIGTTISLLFSAFIRNSAVEKIQSVETVAIPDNWSAEDPLAHIADLILERYEVGQAQVQTTIKDVTPAGGDLSGTYPNPKVVKGRMEYFGTIPPGLLVDLNVPNAQSTMVTLEVTGNPYSNSPAIKSILNFYDYKERDYVIAANILHLGKDIGEPLIFRGTDGFLKVYFPHTGFSSFNTFMFSAVTNNSSGTEVVKRIRQIAIPEDWNADDPFAHIQDLILDGYEARTAGTFHGLTTYNYSEHCLPVTGGEVRGATSFTGTSLMANQMLPVPDSQTKYLGISSNPWNQAYIDYLRVGDSRQGKGPHLLAVYGDVRMYDGDGSSYNDITPVLRNLTASGDGQSVLASDGTYKTIDEINPSKIRGRLVSNTSKYMVWMKDIVKVYESGGPNHPCMLVLEITGATLMGREPIHTTVCTYINAKDDGSGKGTFYNSFLPQYTSITDYGRPVQEAVLVMDRNGRLGLCIDYGEGGSAIKVSGYNGFRADWLSPYGVDLVHSVTEIESLDQLDIFESLTLTGGDADSQPAYRCYSKDIAALVENSAAVALTKSGDGNWVLTDDGTYKQLDALRLHNNICLTQGSRPKKIIVWLKNDIPVYETGVTGAAYYLLFHITGSSGINREEINTSVSTYVFTAANNGQYNMKLHKPGTATTDLGRMLRDAKLFLTRDGRLGLYLDYDIEDASVIRAQAYSPNEAQWNTPLGTDLVGSIERVESTDGLDIFESLTLTGGDAGSQPAYRCYSKDIATLQHDSVLKDSAAGGDLTGTYPNPQVVKGKVAYISTNLIPSGVLVNFSVKGYQAAMITTEITGLDYGKNEAGIKSLLNFYSTPDGRIAKRSIHHLGRSVGTPLLFVGTDGYLKAYFPHTDIAGYDTLMFSAFDHSDTLAKEVVESVSYIKVESGREYEDIYEPVRDMIAEGFEALPAVTSHGLTTYNYSEHCLPVKGGEVTGNITVSGNRIYSHRLEPIADSTVKYLGTSTNPWHLQYIDRIRVGDKRQGRGPHLLELYGDMYVYNEDATSYNNVTPVLRNLTASGDGQAVLSDDGTYKHVDSLVMHKNVAYVNNAGLKNMIIWLRDIVPVGESGLEGSHYTYLTFNIEGNPMSTSEPIKTTVCTYIYPTTSGVEDGTHRTYFHQSFTTTTDYGMPLNEAKLFMTRDGRAGLYLDYPVTIASIKAEAYSARKTTWHEPYGTDLVDRIQIVSSLEEAGLDIFNTLALNEGNATTSPAYRSYVKEIEQIKESNAEILARLKALESA